MTWLAERRRRREFDRLLRITALEKETGVTLTHPELDLPEIRVVRNPNDSLGWRSWVALGFPEGDGGTSSGYIYCQTYARSRAGCVAKARDRLYRTAVANQEQPVKVALT